MSLLSSLLNTTYANEIVHLVETKLLALVGKDSGPVIERLITIPSQDVAAICAKTGANPATAEQLQTEATTAYENFVSYLATGTDGTPPVGSEPANPEA